MERISVTSLRAGSTSSLEGVTFIAHFFQSIHETKEWGLLGFFVGCFVVLVWFLFGFLWLFGFF